MELLSAGSDSWQRRWHWLGGQPRAHLLCLCFALWFVLAVRLGSGAAANSFQSTSPPWAQGLAPNEPITRARWA